MSASHFRRFAIEGRPWRINVSAAIELVDEVLLDPDRQFPAVGVSTSPDFDRCLVDPERLARALRGHALVVVVPHGRESWAIANRMAPELAVHGGFARIWMPGLSRYSEGVEHKVFPVYSDQGGVQVIEQIVLAVRYGLRPAVHRRPMPGSGGSVEQGVSNFVGVHVPFDPNGPNVTELGWWSSRGA